MRQYIIIAVIVAIMAQPSPIFAQTAAGVEFQTPLVQQIFNLLHERIEELNSKIEELRAQKTIVETRVIRESCAPVGTSEPVDTREDDIREEYARKQAGIDTHINDTRTQITKITDDYRKYNISEISDKLEQDVMDWSGMKGGLPDDFWRSGHFNVVIDYLKSEIERLEQRKDELQVEMNRELNK